MTSPDRHDALEQFVAAALKERAFTLAPASADASFRSYWRARDGASSWVVMDAPPQQEDVETWLDIDARLRIANLHAPEVHAVDVDQGFVLMEDLGTRTYLPELSEASVETLYAAAFDALLRMQHDVPVHGLPVFDATRTIPEMELLGPWFLERHLGFSPTLGDWEIIENAFRLIATAADEQPRRFMHRDYHSRNLLVADRNSPAIIDFQGAMYGPITYDLASLLRDCYIAWPSERIDAWVEAYRRRLAAEDIANVGPAQFRRWFDSIGLQRHVKVLGLFCRLCYRDGKPGYLADLPRVRDYVLGVARLYPALLDFADLIERAAGDRDIAQVRAADPPGT